RSSRSRWVRSVRVCAVAALILLSAASFTVGAVAGAPRSGDVTSAAEAYRAADRPGLRSISRPSGLGSVRGSATGTTRVSAQTTAKRRPKPRSVLPGATPNGSVTPPDPINAAGSTTVVSATNERLQMRDRSGGASTASWHSLGTASVSDPQVIWDPATERFYFVILDVNVPPFGTSNGVDFWYGFSKTDSPSAASDWCVYPVSVGY